MEEKLYIKNDLGEEKEVTILCSFEKKGKKVIIYTNFEHTKENKILCYSSYLSDNKLEKIKEEEVFITIEELLKTLTTATKCKYQLLKKEE